MQMLLRRCNRQALRGFCSRGQSLATVEGAATCSHQRLVHTQQWPVEAAATGSHQRLVHTQQWPVQAVVGLPDVFVVRTIAEAEHAVHVLRTAGAGRAHAWDTEVANINVSKQSPVGNGTLLCMSCYAGPDVSFGSHGQCRLWVDCWGEDGGVPAAVAAEWLSQGIPEQAGPDVLRPFRSYFAQPDVQLVWHNYSFDAHILRNYGVEPNGLVGDTMHMARLWDSSLGHDFEAGSITRTSDSSTTSEAEAEAKAMRGYGLAALSKRMLGRDSWKTDMKSLFGRPKLRKDGTPGKAIFLPPLEEVQTSADHHTVAKWVHYSTLDAQSTWELFHNLSDRLRDMPLYRRGFGSPAEAVWEPHPNPHPPSAPPTMMMLYRRGIHLDRDFLNQQRALAEADRDAAIATFREKLVAGGYVAKEDASSILLSSSLQMAHLIFGGHGEPLEVTVDNPLYGEPLPPELQPQPQPGLKSEDESETEQPLSQQEADLEPHKTRRQVAKKPTPRVLKHKRKKQIILCGMGLSHLSDTVTSSGRKSIATDVLNSLIGKPVEEFILPSDADLPQFNRLATNCDVDGAAKASPAVERIEDDTFCPAALRKDALVALQKARGINTLIGTFFDNLAASVGRDGRVHASLNLNTTTGRLSCKAPNLQNQPALEKDKYMIRHAFRAESGNSLIVADYGQLELRVLAHIANDDAMLRAFELGGDFHSRTAMSMYDYVANAVDNGDVLLEAGDGTTDNNAEPKPLLSKKYSAERRKAKVLNFSIAYGKTAFGLAKDFGVSTEEAQATVDAWYDGRPAVKRWQADTIARAGEDLFVSTLLGRQRRLPNMALPPRHRNYRAGTRAAINTPIQGSAADIVMLAMIALEDQPRLRELGFKLLLQIHDEVILEGPEEHADEALALVIATMAAPMPQLEKALRVELAVDANIGDSWYEAK